jgi:HPr kinase/phosphorylase
MPPDAAAGKPAPLHVEELWKSQAEPLRLSLLAGQQGFRRLIRVADINRPGLTLAGFFEFYRGERMQVFGMGESAFTSTLSSAQRMEIFRSPLVGPRSPLRDPDPWPRTGSRDGGAMRTVQVPLFQSQWETARFIGELTAYLEERLAPHFPARDTGQRLRDGRFDLGIVGDWEIRMRP